jgi:hypothetical protein
VLAQSLPEGHVDALTLFDEGASLLIRQNYVDAAFFTALAREFPKRNIELAELAGKCGIHWLPPQRVPAPTQAPSRIRYWVGLAVILAVGATLAPQIWRSPASPAKEIPAETQRVEPNIASLPDAPVPDAPVPGAPADLEGSTDPVPPKPPPENPSKGDHPRVLPRPNPDSKAALPPSDPKPELPKVDVPAPKEIASETCAIPESLRIELRALGQATFVAPGPSKKFTVTLPKGAPKPRVSPTPKDYETDLKKLHTHLTGLSAADLGNCFDRAIEVSFSADQTTVEFQE